MTMIPKKITNKSIADIFLLKNKLFLEGILFSYLFKLY